jgi:DNA-binding MarR family transcriptional regulator
MMLTFDTESRTTEADHLAIRLWLRMLACTNLVGRRVAVKLRDAHATTLPRFDFLSQLERSPDGLRMTEISRRMMVTAGNITRLADQLVAEGLITRTPAADDRRAAIVQLTARGRRIFDQMAREHEGWIVAMFDGLDEGERHALFDLLGRLKRHLNTGDDGRPR